MDYELQFAETKSKLPESVVFDLNKVVEKLRSYNTSQFLSAELAGPATHFLGNSGKLLRPVLVFLGARYASAKDTSQLVDLSAAIELLHVSSLLHDDLIDKDTERRGSETVHKKYGNERAILAGDALISMATQEACKYGTATVDAISKTAMQMCAGEALDFAYQERKDVPDLDMYLEIARLKSASLIATAASIGAQQRGDEDAEALRRFGKNFGIAFQIMDDVKDFTCIGNECVDKGDLAYFRPNIMHTLTRIYKTEGVAIMKAVELNNEYLDAAMRSINSSKEPLLAEYAEWIRLQRTKS